MDIHIVQPGDTMYRLAQQYGVPMERLIQDNRLQVYLNAYRGRDSSPSPAEK